MIGINIQRPIRFNQRPQYLSLYCWRFRIFDLHPMRNSTGAVRRAKPLRHGALATELTCRPVDARTVVLEILIEYDAQMRTLEQLGEHALRFSTGATIASIPKEAAAALKGFR